MEKIINIIDKITKDLNDLKSELINSNMVSDFDKLKQLLHSDQWPIAADPEAVCDKNSESDKIDRARIIIDMMINEPLLNKKFLDYGCEEGHISYIAADDNPVTSVGYFFNLKENKNFTIKSNHKSTDSWEEVLKESPYNVILAMDVLDHSSASIEENLQKIHSVLSDDGCVYIRCHPFTSKHAIHNYYDTNKAYIHLVFTEEELKTLGISCHKNKGVVRPIMTYRKAIEDCNFEIITEDITKEDVEPFFRQPLIVKRIMQNTGFTELPIFQMQQSWIDYKLKKK